MAEMAKIYRITGFFYKGKKKVPIRYECRALKIEDAIELAFSDIGSRHRVKRSNIYINKSTGVEEISPEEAKNPEFSDITSEDFVIYR